MLHLCRLRVRNSHGHLRRRHRDHRQRLLRPRDGDPPQAGGDRGLHRARTRGRRGRHLALQHLPGLRLRRALAPLLLLLRAQPRLDRHLLAPARDPRLPAAGRRPVRHPPARAAELRRQRHRVGRRRLDRRDLRRAAARARRDRRHGPAGGAQDAAARGARRLRGRDLPLRALEPRLRPQGQARRRRRHGRLGDPVRARDPEGRRAVARDPAHAAVGHAAPEPADPAQRGAPLRTLPVAAEARARQRLRRARAARARVRQEPAADAAPGADRAAAHAEPDRRPGLLEKVTPGYTIGCKRILPSNQWYRALSQPNVELLTGGVERSRRTRS